jgi:hypothetical protein
MNIYLKFFNIKERCKKKMECRYDGQKKGCEKNDTERMGEAKVPKFV